MTLRDNPASDAGRNAMMPALCSTQSLLLTETGKLEECYKFGVSQPKPLATMSLCLQCESHRRSPAGRMPAT